MTEEMKQNDATQHFVIEFGDKFRLIDTPFNNEGDARKHAEDLSLASPGVKYGVFTKSGTVVAALKAEWKGRGV